jgi:hypothetical protein
MPSDGLAGAAVPGRRRGGGLWPWKEGSVDDTTQLILLLAPIALLQLGLMIFGLVDLAKRQRIRGPKWAWGLVIVLFGFLGPIAYFLAGREE